MYYKLPTNYIRTSLWTSYKFLRNFLETSFKLLTNFLQTSYKLLTNFSQTSHKLLTIYLQTSHKFLTKLLRAVLEKGCIIWNVGMSFKVNFVLLRHHSLKIDLKHFCEFHPSFFHYFVAAGISKNAKKFFFHSKKWFLHFYSCGLHFNLLTA
jgi:hypothetical protein